MGSLGLPQRWQPWLLALLRIVTALLFIEDGTQKLLGFPAPTRPAPAFLTLPWIAGVLEIVGGALVLIGLWTRASAFVLSGLMAFAYWMAHAPRDPYPILNGGEAAILFCFVFLYIACAGPGAFAADRR